MVFGGGKTPNCSASYLEGQLSTRGKCGGKTPNCSVPYLEGQLSTRGNCGGKF